MKANIEYKLDGSFKVDSFDRNGKLLETTDYFSNFITYSGLMYPLIFPFAECFKFLSLGSSSAQNQTTTTGVVSLEPISFLVENVNNPSVKETQVMSYLGPKNFSLGNCGTTVPKTGPVLFRAWKIPTGSADMVLGEDVTINEFVVSPGSGSDPSGRVAFSRVPREVTIRSGTSSIVSYRLKLNIDTGINLLTGFDLSQADKSEGELVTGWSGVTGFYRQVYHGLSLVNKDGNSFIPKFGDVMEPSSKNINKFFAYFSADNSQFDCSTSGGKASSFNASYQANGLAQIGFNHDYSDSDLEDPKDYKFKSTDIKAFPESANNYIPDIRLKSTGAAYHNFTGFNVPHDFTLPGVIDSSLALAISAATPGHIGFKQDILDFRNKNSVAAGIFAMKFNPTGLLQQDRKKVIIKKAVFTPVRSYGHNTRYGSFVYGFNNGSYWPIIDCLFSNSSGQLLMDHWRRITGIHIVDSGGGLVGGCEYPALKLSPESYGKFNYFPLVNQEGQVTGFLYSGKFQYDKALANHSIYNLTFPTTTGDIYAETSTSSKNKIKIDLTNLTYYKEGFGYISNNAYPFSQTKQLFADVRFSGINAAGNTGTSFLSGKQNLTLTRSNIQTGFYITSEQYTGRASELNLNQTALAYSLTGFVLSGFSGYIYSGSTFFTGVDVVTEIEPSGSDYAFLIKNIPNDNTDYRIAAIRLARLFGTGDYLSTIAKRGSGLTLPDSKFTIKFSGKDTGDNNLYLTYLTRPAPHDGSWSGTSQITGLIEYTNFNPPILLPMHEEMGALKPNNYSIGYTGNTISMENHGGAYPGLSDLNTLTMDINTFWSAPCGGVAGCTDPV